MKKHKRGKSNAASKISFLTLSNLGLFGWLIVILSLTIITFLVSILLNPRSFHYRDNSFSTISLQILNGCGINGASSSLAEALSPGNGDIIYDIIEKADAKHNEFEKTLLIDRVGGNGGGPSEKAKSVAKHLGILGEEILTVKFEDNLLNIDVTIIAGSDYADYVENLNRSREEIF